MFSQYRYQFLWCALIFAFMLVFFWGFIAQVFGPSFPNPGLLQYGMLVICIYGYMMSNHFIMSPTKRMRFYKEHRLPMGEFHHHGYPRGNMRKLRIVCNGLERTLNSEIMIGFLWGSLYLTYGSVQLKNGVAVVETYFGTEECDFLFLCETEVYFKYTVYLLPVGSLEPADVSFRAHWWQKPGFLSLKNHLQKFFEH